MAFEIVTKREEPSMEWFEVTERLYLTEDGRAVPEGDPDQRWLYAIPGSRVPLSEAKKYGLVDESGSDDDLSKANKDRLIAEAEDRGLDTSGTKKELRARITEHDESASEDDSTSDDQTEGTDADDQGGDESGSDDAGAPDDSAGGE